MRARTKSAERSAANPGSAKRYRIFAPFCGSGKRAEKNRRSARREGEGGVKKGRKKKIGRRAGSQGGKIEQRDRAVAGGLVESRDRAVTKIVCSAGATIIETARNTVRILETHFIF